MDQFINKTELYFALQSCGLGVIVGALFAIFGLKPPVRLNFSVFTGFWIKS